MVQSQMRLKNFILHFVTLTAKWIKTGRRYIGSCEDLPERICRHNAGESKATKHGVPWVLVHGESFATRSEAAQRERYYKTGRGRDELDKLR